jgi:hypothetical protein
MLRQLSLFLENRPGQLRAPCEALARAGVDILSLSLADTDRFGILRLVVRDAERGKRALEEAGIGVPSSCQDGICGTCETKVLEGPVDHRDFLLSDEEKAAGASMMVCVSRAAGDRLVLDV